MNLERELRRFVRQIRPGLIGATSNPNTNLMHVIQELKNAPAMREDLARRLEEFLLTRDFVSALTETGLTLETGVFGEIFKRLEYKILPKPVESADILSFLTRVFDAQSDATWLERIDRKRFSEFLLLLLPAREGLVEGLAPQFFMSLEILSLRLGGLGYDPLVTMRLRPRREYQHAFMDVTRQVHALLDGKGEEAVPAIREALERCRKSVEWIRSRRGTDGISLALTYRLMKILQIVQRMELVLQLAEAALVEWKNEPAEELFFEIILAELRRFDLGQFFGHNIELLAFQVTEHIGKTGEHYITRSRSEWRQMFKSAAIGGAIVGVMAVLKLILSALNMPPGAEALTYGVMYSAGLLLIHITGGTLATKQPAMTASALAASLDGAADSLQAMKNLSAVIVCTIRSQMIALFGNMLVAFPVAALLCYGFALIKLPIMSPEKAMASMDALHLWKSLSFFYAAIVGVGLFVTGLMAGFADNWFVFNHVGSRLKNSELLRKLVGAPNLDRAIHTIDHELGFWVGNVSLGIYFGIIPALGKAFGLPLDTRHVSFATGQFGAALTSLKFQVPAGLIVLIVVSIFCMGLINLGVSFSLSLLVAVKSRRIRFDQTPKLLRLLARHFLHRPQDFFFPQRDAG